MIREHRDAGSDDEDHEKQVQKVLPAHPSGKPDRSITGQFGQARISVNEALHRGKSPDAAGSGDADQKQQ